MEKRLSRTLEKAGIQPSDYEGPTTINFLITQQAPQLGIETLWFIVHLPQYVQLDENYMGKVRLMEVLGSLYNFPEDETDAAKAEQQLEERLSKTWRKQESSPVTMRVRLPLTF